jgi:RNA polymerase II-associated protein 2
MTSFLDYLKEDDPVSSDGSPEIQVNDQQKSTALQYARSIQYQKSMKERVLDLIINTVDLPSLLNADPGRPSASDATLFRRALSLFQPQDFDDMILERNIYEKCGYALCVQPNLKQDRVLRDQVFRRMKEGRKYRLTTKEELDKWCSVECAERAIFVRLQLAIEPAWLRSTPLEEIILLDESGKGVVEEGLASTMQDLGLTERHRIDLASSLQNLAIDQSKKGDTQARMQELSMERGAGDRGDINEVIMAGIMERDGYLTPSAPQSSREGNDLVEGYKPRNVHLGRQSVSEQHGKNTETNS